jgi:hypothetical protein
MEAGKHIGGQLFKLRIHNGIQGFYKSTSLWILTV